ncbi:MAG: arsenate reductase ArsC [Smithellaceae bacterium]|nr:arsenate reductase ArsC [Smithellaceae bacterium]HOS14781.1 arsenate reductase ArsC [Smithella sp.]MDD3258113.1 arsenate reductase ArsC [Smithellaceae bacterium]MDD3848620.1 arsenate reductase ArsC [Smithellaceae bacterium]HOC60304.1 arsenate reductase ArsC [Smithellaceae bacterium]
MKKRVLFLCTANSSRSQMAEGIVNHFLGDRLEAFSAGTQASFVNPTAIKAMKEIGVNISHHRSKHLSEFDGQTFHFVITLCGDANETCPLYIGGTKKTHIGFDDPAKATGSPEDILWEFRRVRDEIIDKITNYFLNIA